MLKKEKCLFKSESDSESVQSINILRSWKNKRRDQVGKKTLLNYGH